ncbi:MAG: S8 family serine peptidase [Flavobacteriia bacterium]|nr:S8 family serine peptidase [Flavobacteriia bacterium]
MNCTRKSIHALISLVTFVFFGSGLWVQAQTAEQKKQLAATVRVSSLNKVLIDLKEEQKELDALSKYLPSHFKKPNQQLIGFGADGSPLFYEVLSNEPATTKNKAAFTAGSAMMNGTVLSGENMEVALWDQGLPRTSHQEFNERLSLGDQSASTNYSHATMVSGILLAAGKNQDAKGVAPKARAISFDWLQDRIEAAEAAAQGLLISNHSYGISVSNLPQWYFGAYLKISQDWDAIQYNAPYYLSITASGNHAQGNDRLVGFNTSKNSLSVGASMSSSNHNVAPFSAYGPTDDGRIKPDLVAPGTQLFSASSVSDQSYASGSGTSFSTPLVSGAALIAQEAYHKTTTRFLKAASLKGLLMHTALDVDQIGPDFKRGWGVLQQDQALAFIGNLDATSSLLEANLSHGQETTHTFTAGQDGMKISLSWTDLPGEYVNRGTLNPTNKALVHDLDIRVYKDGVIYEPYVLNAKAPLAAATRGDNSTDPFEQIQLSEPGTYTLVISHKGSLKETQAYSLLISGLWSDSEITQTRSESPQTTELPTALQAEITETLEDPKTISLTAYPNPAVNELKVEGLDNSSFKYYIYRSDGSIAAKGSTENGKVAVSRLSNGFYILGVFHSKGYEAVKFFKR